MADLRCYYVYELADPRDGKVFYVGKGKGRRINQHVQEAKSGKIGNPFKLDHIREILRAGHKVTERIVSSGLTEQDALRMEREHIASYGIGSLTNIAAGTETAAAKAKSLLDRIKPFDQWIAERPTGLDGKPADPKWYHLIVAGLRKEAGLTDGVF
jgi:hypothetical protein